MMKQIVGVNYVDNYLLKHFSWAYLTVVTNDKFSNRDQAYAAGVVEAHLTKDLITMHWKNTVEGRQTRNT